MFCRNFTSGSSTSGLIKHINSRHPEIDLKLKTDVSAADEYLSRNSCELSVVRLVCEDNVSFNKICKNMTLRKIFKKAGMDLPTSRATVKRYIESYYLKVCEIMKRDVSTKLNNALKCYLTIDEWTSNSNRKYLNVNIHFSDNTFYCIGVIRIKGAATATNLPNLIDLKLKNFGSP